MPKRRHSWMKGVATSKLESPLWHSNPRERMQLYGGALYWHLATTLTEKYKERLQVLQLPIARKSLAVVWMPT